MLLIIITAHICYLIICKGQPLVNNSWYLIFLPHVLHSASFQELTHKTESSLMYRTICTSVNDMRWKGPTNCDTYNGKGIKYSKNPLIIEAYTLSPPITKYSENATSETNVQLLRHNELLNMQLKLIDIALMNVYSVVLSLLLACSWLHKASRHVYNCYKVTYYLRNYFSINIISVMSHSVIICLSYLCNIM